MANEGGGNNMGPEDFGLGSDFDDALAQATDGGGKKETADSPGPGGGAGGMALVGDETRPQKMDFSKLKMILDIPLKVTVELGRTKMLVNDLLQLGQGSVIELDKIAGEPMEILINDKLVALGEVVVVNEKFGVRLTDVISQFGLNDLAHSEKAAG
jgi:flagellar motor switch protein FliN/FliY